MTTTVYWAYAGVDWQMAYEPELVSSIFYKKKLWITNDFNTQIAHCPAVKKPFENLYALKSVYDYEFEIFDGTLRTKMYDQDFFNKHVNIRSVEKRFFSFILNYIFFTDATSLPITFGFMPYLEDNNVSARCMQIPGEIDIGKWFRPTDMPFYLKNDYNSFKIERGEIYSYFKIHSTEKIEFQQFRMTDSLYQFIDEGFALNFNRYMKTLENYYKMFKNKKFILKEIKNNLV